MIIGKTKECKDKWAKAIGIHFSQNTTIFIGSIEEIF